ncbi:MAG: single-stranded DNA-binding protein [Deltaproteobacteria bacterium]|jgi:single-strand DNA-binding protein|nr:single-stranded DNA-binding protein [Deltaproteobacteria bacterium]
MASVNKVILLGRLGRDPEMRRTQSGKNVTNFSLATSERWNNEDHVEWHKIVLFDRLAEIAKEYLRKGSQVYLEGRIQTNSWEDQAGNKRNSTEIYANSMVILTPKKDSSGYGGGPTNYNSDPVNSPPPNANPTNFGSPPNERDARLASDPTPAPSPVSVPAPAPVLAPVPVPDPVAPAKLPDDSDLPDSEAKAAEAVEEYPLVKSEPLANNGELPF